MDQTVQGTESESTERRRNLVLDFVFHVIDDAVDLVVDGVELFVSQVNSDSFHHSSQSLYGLDGFGMEVTDEVMCRRYSFEFLDKADFRLNGFHVRSCNGSLVEACLTKNDVKNLFHDFFSMMIVFDILNIVKIDLYVNVKF